MIELMGAFAIVFAAIIGVVATWRIFSWERFNKDEEHRLKFHEAKGDPELAESYLRRVARWIQRVDVGPEVVRVLQDIPQWRQGLDRYLRARQLLEFDERRGHFTLVRWKLPFLLAAAGLVLYLAAGLPGDLETDLLRSGVGAVRAAAWRKLLWLSEIPIVLLFLGWIISIFADAQWLVQETRRQAERRRAALLAE